ncbi:MAG TPA: serine hydrolase, partial [Gaiellaceae bacterium]|nr:serine hydrolase [Gaiellaceae bacterium]
PRRPGAGRALHRRGAGGEGGLIAWAAVDPVTGAVEHENGSSVFAAASTIKLFVYSAFRRSKLEPNEARPVARVGGSGVTEYLQTPLPLADHAFLMLAVSDNASTNVLLERLGFDAVAEEIGRLGLRDTRVRRAMMSDGPENETTPLDLAKGLARLLEEVFAADMLDALRVAADAESFLPHLLPDVVVAAKSGQLDTVRHEVAFLERGERRLVTAVCSSPPARPDELAAVAAQRWAA